MTFALRETIVVLAEIVVGGMNRLLSATLGGFAIGYASGLLGGALPTAQSQYLPSFLFGLVILTLLSRPGGLFTRGRGPVERGSEAAADVPAGARARGARRRDGGRRDVLRALDGDLLHQRAGLLQVSVVVAIYVFVGNSGVLSFGHISFVAVGAWTAGVLSVPVEEKTGDDAQPLRVPLGHVRRQRPVAPARRARRRASSLLLAGLPLMRLSGLAAGIATFAVLEITSNILRYYERIGPGLNVFSSVPETTDMQQAAIGAVVAIGVAFAYQVSRYGRQLRAARDDAPAARAVGISVYRQRLIAFGLSGALAGFAGGLYVHYLPINVDAVYLDLTFITLAMLVIGGMTSLWGAVVGALAVSGLDSLLAEAENGAVGIDLPSGSRIVVVGALMALVLILRPEGITGGREVRFRRLTRPRTAKEGAA